MPTIIAIPKETLAGEKRVAATPTTVKKLSALGATVCVEQHAGAGAYLSDSDYIQAGAKLMVDHQQLLRQADLVVSVNPLAIDELTLLSHQTTTLSFANPFFNADWLQACTQTSINVLSMDMIPRTTRAQSMDALSSQANLAGYAAVILATHHLPHAFPMMTTAAGIIEPSRIFVVGAGVAGLQAIATAKRLGARVMAYDTRPAVAEQITSLAADVLTIDLGETGQTQQGYAKALSAEQLAQQQQAMQQACANANVIITTAQVFGAKAPRLITDTMIAGMQPGSVIIDMAASTGGNVAHSQPDQMIEQHGVMILGPTQLASDVALHASQMYANNIAHFIDEFWDPTDKKLQLPLDDDIINHCLLIQSGQRRESR